MNLAFWRRPPLTAEQAADLIRQAMRKAQAADLEPPLGSPDLGALLESAAIGLGLSGCEVASLAAELADAMGTDPESAVRLLRGIPAAVLRAESVPPGRVANP